MTDIDVLKLWTIYKHPDDYPEGYVARQWIIADGGNHYAGVARYRPDLEAARAAIPPGLYRLDRDPNDDPKIVETWI